MAEKKPQIHPGRPARVAAALICVALLLPTRASALKPWYEGVSVDTYRVRLDVSREEATPRIMESMATPGDAAKFTGSWTVSSMPLAVSRRWYDVVGFVGAALGLEPAPAAVHTVRDVRISAGVTPAGHARDDGVGVFSVKYTVDAGVFRVVADLSGANPRDRSPRISRVIVGKAELKVGDMHPFDVDDGTGGRVRGTLTVFRVRTFRT